MSVRVMIQKFGSKLSNMVIPNLGAFIAWGLLTAVGIGINNEMLRGFVTPMLNYLLPLLIAFAGGKMVYDYRGGVIGTVATIGVIIGSSVTMFIGAMILGPLSAWVLKKFDQVIDGKIPMGFELLVNNYSIGIIGAVLAVFGCVILGPAISSLTTVFAGGVDVLINTGLLPLTAILIEPAKVLFLNNAIGQGILTPMGTTQLESLGKSVLFLLESNPGPGLGVLLAYMFFGKGTSRSSAWGASVIHLFGGIHEIYFPFVLMNPVLILPLIVGGAVGTFLFNLFGVGLVGVASPGSIISIMMMSYPGDRLMICLAILAACAVSFLISVPLVKRASGNDESLKNCIRLAEGDFFRALEQFIQEAWSYLKKNNICSLQKNVAMQANANPLYVLEELSSEGKESRFTELSNWIYDHVDRSKLKVADQREFQSLLVVCYINIMVTAIELCMRPGQEEELLKMHNIRMRFLQEGVLNHE